MVDPDDSIPPQVGDLDPELVTLAVELAHPVAEREIDKAVRGRRGIARKYVKWVRRRNPDATPAEVIAMLERHYVTAISAAGAAITIGTIAAEVGIAMIPVVGPAAAGAKAAAKEAGKRAVEGAAKAAVKAVALGAAKSGSQKAVAMLPAGDEQLQFEITAVFALAIADIHGMELDQGQAHALVYGLSNGRVGQDQIAIMASDLAQSSNSSMVGVGKTIASGREDWGHWANTLADALPEGTAQSLVRGMQTGALEHVRGALGEKQKAAVEYGVGALVGGVTRFVFGREVVDASRAAFAKAPTVFPDHLALEAKSKSDQDDTESNRALEALTEAGRSVGVGVKAGVGAVGSGLATAAGAASRPFRSVDLDGDGIADEAQSLTAAKDVGAAIAGKAEAVGGFLTSPFKKKRPDQPDT